MQKIMPNIQNRNRDAKGRKLFKAIKAMDLSTVSKGEPIGRQQKDLLDFSLLSVLSKLFKKLLFLRFSIIIKKHKSIPNHQFGFQYKHATIEQIHRIVKRINNDIEAVRYCMEVFLDVLQVFDKICHNDLLYKTKNSFPSDFYLA